MDESSTIDEFSPVESDLRSTFASGDATQVLLDLARRATVTEAAREAERAVWSKLKIIAATTAFLLAVLGVILTVAVRSAFEGFEAKSRESSRETARAEVRHVVGEAQRTIESVRDQLGAELAILSFITAWSVVGTEGSSQELLARFQRISITPSTTERMEWAAMLRFFMPWLVKTGDEAAVESVRVHLGKYGESNQLVAAYLTLHSASELIFTSIAPNEWATNPTASLSWQRFESDIAHAGRLHLRGLAAPLQLLVAMRQEGNRMGPMSEAYGAKLFSLPASDAVFAISLFGTPDVRERAEDLFPNMDDERDHSALLALIRGFLQANSTDACRWLNAFIGSDANSSPLPDLEQAFNSWVQRGMPLGGGDFYSDARLAKSRACGQP